MQSAGTGTIMAQPRGKQFKPIPVSRGLDRNLAATLDRINRHLRAVPSAEPNISGSMTPASNISPPADGQVRKAGSLTDLPAVPHGTTVTWSFPVGTVVPAGETLKLAGDYYQRLANSTLTLRSDGQRYYEIGRIGAGPFRMASEWGAVPDTGADMTVAIQLALDECPANETLVFLPGTYICSGLIVMTQALTVYAYGAVFDYGSTNLGSDYAFAVGDTSSTQVSLASVNGLKVVRTYTFDLDTASAGPGTGIAYRGFGFIANNRCTYRDLFVEGFSLGYYLAGRNGVTGAGCAENVFDGLHALNCRYSLTLEQSGADAFVNENDFYNFEHQHSSSFSHAHTVHATYGIEILRILWAAVDHAPNNNRFWGCNWEAPSSQRPAHRKARIEGLENYFYSCRWEGHNDTTAIDPGTGLPYSARSGLDGIDITIGKTATATNYMTRNVFFHGTELNGIVDDTRYEFIGTSTINNKNQFITAWGSIWAGGNVKPGISMYGGGDTTDLIELKKVTGAASRTLLMRAGGPSSEHGFIGFYDNSTTRRNYLSLSTSALNSIWNINIDQGLTIGNKAQFYPGSGDDLIIFPLPGTAGGRIVVAGNSAYDIPVLVARHSASSSRSFAVKTAGDADAIAMIANPTDQYGAILWYAGSTTERNRIFMDNSSPYALAAKGSFGWASSDGAAHKYVAFKAPVVSTSVSYTLPAADGAAGTALTTDGAATLSWSQTVPAGCIQMYAGSSAPTGWLICDGSAVSRTTYAGLFAITSTTYGAGDGSTTFNLPDLRDRFPRGKSGTVALGATGGATTYSHSGTAVAPHSTNTAEGNVVSTPLTVVTTATHSVTQPSNHTGVEPPYLSLNFIIKT